MIANGALFKLRHYIPFKTLVNIYHAIFSSHEICLSSLGSLWQCCLSLYVNITKICTETYYFQCTKNTFKSYSNRIINFSNLGILKIFYLVEILNINIDLPEDQLNTFDFSKISHSLNTRGSCLGLLKVSSVNTKTYGLHSILSRAFLTLISLKYLILILNTYLANFIWKNI